ncbi:unnamed protein product, partial [Allacma fusca]
NVRIGKKINRDKNLLSPYSYLAIVDRKIRNSNSLESNITRRVLVVSSGLKPSGEFYSPISTDIPNATYFRISREFTIQDSQERDQTRRKRYEGDCSSHQTMKACLSTPFCTWTYKKHRRE